MKPYKSKAQIKFLEEVLQLEPEIDKGGEEIWGMSGYGDTSSEGPGLGTEGDDKEMGEGGSRELTPMSVINMALTTS